MLQIFDMAHAGAIYLEPSTGSDLVQLDKEPCLVYYGSVHVALRNPGNYEYITLKSNTNNRPSGNERIISLGYAIDNYCMLPPNGNL